MLKETHIIKMNTNKKLNGSLIWISIIRSRQYTKSNNQHKLTPHLKSLANITRIKSLPIKKLMEATLKVGLKIKVRVVWTQVQIILSIPQAM